MQSNTAPLKVLTRLQCRTNLAWQQLEWGVVVGALVGTVAEIVAGGWSEYNTSDCALVAFGVYRPSLLPSTALSFPSSLLLSR